MEDHSNHQRPTRKLKQPEKLKEYVVYNTKELPKTYEEAMSSPENENWNEAMMDELESMETNKVWKIVERPKNSKVIKSRWIFTKKQNNLDICYVNIC